MLVKFSLTLISNFFWVDYEKTIYSGETLIECKIKAIPIILHMKKTLEDKVEDEFRPE